MILVALRSPAPALTISVTGLRTKREDLGLRRPELALLSGLPLDTLWELEAGALSPSHEQRVALMRALDADFEELFTVRRVTLKP